MLNVESSPPCTEHKASRLRTPISWRQSFLVTSKLPSTPTLGSSSEWIRTPEARPAVQHRVLPLLRHRGLPAADPLAVLRRD
jgi:hypothetical protein